MKETGTGTDPYHLEALRGIRIEDRDELIEVLNKIFPPDSAPHDPYMLHTSSTLGKTFLDVSLIALHNRELNTVELQDRLAECLDRRMPTVYVQVMDREDITQ